MHPDLEAFLAGYSPMAEERTIWPGSGLAFRVTSYLCQDAPPLDSVTSVRSLMFRDDCVLVVRDPEGHHILPGGRRENGEALGETLRRELLEETGWTIQDPLLLGWMHFHHLCAKPPGYLYPYPDFLQLIYTAEAVELFADERDIAGYEIEADFQPLAVVRAMDLTSGQRLFLEAAVQHRSETNRTEPVSSPLQRGSCV